MGWKTDLTAGNLRGIFGLVVDGDPWVYVSAQPKAPNGASWTAPVDAGGAGDNTYTVVAGALDVSKGLGLHRERWNARDGAMAGGGATFRLVSTAAIRAHFATRLATGHKTYLAHTVDYDYAAALGWDRYRARVRSTTGFTDPAVSGVREYVWVGGSECVGYDAMTATQFGDNTAANISRGAYRWQSDQRLDRRHSINDGERSTPRFVTDYIPNWVGRVARLLFWPCDDHGNCVDTQYHSTNEIEIWAGVIEDVVRGTDVYELRCQSLAEWYLSQPTGFKSTEAEVGGPGLDAALIKDIGYGEAQFNNCILIPSDGSATFDETHVLLRENGTGDVLEGQYTVREFMQHAAATLETWIDGQIGGVGVTINVTYVLNVLHHVGPRAQFTIEAAGLAVTYTVGINILPGWLFGDIAAEPDGRNNNGFSEPFGGATDQTASYIIPLALSGRGYDGDEIDEGSRVPAFADTLPIYDPSGDDWDDEFRGRLKYTGEGDEEEHELILWTGATDLGDGYWILTGVLRGLWGTAAREFYYSYGDEERPTLTKLNGAVQPLPILIASLLTSTGIGINGVQDVLNEGVGLGMCASLIDLNSAWAVATSDPYASRNLLVAEPIKLDELVKKEGPFGGWIFGPAMGPDRRFRLRFVKVNPPLLHALAASFSTADGSITKDSVPRVETVGADIVTSLEMKLKWDGATGEHVGEPIYADYASGYEELRKRKSVTIEVDGLAVEDPTGAAVALAERMFAELGEARELFYASVDRRALALLPGACVELTAAGIPTATNEDLNATPAVLEGVERQPFTPGRGAAASIVARIGEAYSALAPSFKVSSYDSGNNRVTIVDNEFTRAGDPVIREDATACYDWHYLPAPADGKTYALWFWPRGDVASRVKRTLTAYGTAGNEFSVGGGTLDSGWFDPGDPDVWAEYADWDDGDLHTDQQRFAYIADSSDTLGAAASVAKKWAP